MKQIKEIEKSKFVEAIKPEVNKQFNSMVGEIAEAEGRSKKEIVQEMKDGINSKNSFVRTKAINSVVKVLDNLTLLVLKSVLEKDFDTNKEQGFNSKFKREDLNEGNSIQYIVSLKTGHSVKSDNFIPGKLSNPSEREQIFSMLKPDGSLEDYAFKFQKNFSAQPESWIPYFNAGNLDTFVAINISYIIETFDAYMYHKNLTILTTESNYGKIVNGTATNLFDCLVNEFFPELETFMLKSSNYNVDKTNYPVIQGTEKNDITILVNSQLMSKLKTAIKSQLPSAQLLSMEDYVGDIFVPGFQYVIPGTNGENTIITVSTSEYVSSDKIYVLDNNLLVNHFQLNWSGEQFFINNLVREHVLHVWGLAGIKKWGKGFVYKNANLVILPGA